MSEHTVRRKQSATCIPFTLFMQSLRPKDQSQWRFRKKAIVAIQMRTERYIANLFQAASQNAQNAGRITTGPLPCECSASASGSDP